MVRKKSRVRFSPGAPKNSHSAHTFSRPYAIYLVMAKVRAYRMSRRKDLSSKYAGWIKLGALTSSCFVAAGIAFTLLANLTVAQALVMLPVTWIIANFVEYSLHRWPMHRVMRGMKAIYKSHSGQHHRYFTHEYMSIETQNDMREVFTKYKVMAFLILAVIIPISGVFALFIQPNIGLLFFIYSLMYYVLYEWTHFATHIPESHWVTKLPYIRGAKRRHTIHHNTRLMREWNFNVSFALFDRIFGTLKE